LGAAAACAIRTAAVPLLLLLLAVAGPLVVRAVLGVGTAAAAAAAVAGVHEAAAATTAEWFIGAEPLLQSLYQFVSGGQFIILHIEKKGEGGVSQAHPPAAQGGTCCGPTETLNP
jgi:hypothetical protein